MRDYGAVSPKFWIGETGKSLRGDMPAQVLALYLMTGPHSSMIGVFHCPIMYMAHETGMDTEGASKALSTLVERGFCEYDYDLEVVFVIRMAAYQVSESLKTSDKRIKWAIKEASSIPSNRILQSFLRTYGEAFHLFGTDEIESPLEAPSEPHQEGATEAPPKPRQDKTGQDNNIPPPKTGDGYAFTGETIRLNLADYDKCVTQYPNLDLDYQLSQLDMELSGKKNWFVEMHSKLNYRNRTPAHHASSAQDPGEMIY